MNYKISVFTLSQLRKLSTGYMLNKNKNHYEALGLKSNATQADIKGAYYELSKVFHPDKNQGNTEEKEEHSQRFRDITAAYEVLGNAKTRRMYDKGFFMGETIHSPESATPDDPLHKFYKSREIRTRPPSSGKTTIYDFDEWAKQHYGATFHKQQEIRKRREFHVRMNTERREYNSQEAVLVGFITVVLMCVAFKQFKNYDTVNVLGTPVIVEKDSRAGADER